MPQMPEAPSQSSGEQQKWSAATAKDRIAIVTTDAALDARIRAALQDEGYDFVTVTSFENNQDELIETNLAIVDSREVKGLYTVRYGWRSSRWSGYPFIGIFAKSCLEAKYSVVMSHPGPQFDMELSEDFSAQQLVYMTKKIIEASKVYYGPYRI